MFAFPKSATGGMPATPSNENVKLASWHDAAGITCGRGALEELVDGVEQLSPFALTVFVCVPLMPHHVWRPSRYSRCAGIGRTAALSVRFAESAASGDGAGTLSRHPSTFATRSCIATRESPTMALPVVFRRRS